MTLNEQFAVWPHESVASQFTMVVPTGNLVPEGGLQDGGGGAAARHPPEAVAVNVTTAPLASGAVAVISAGQVMNSGGCPPLVSAMCAGKLCEGNQLWPPSV